VYWLFYAGFRAGRHGTVHWHGALDGWRLAMIAAAGLGVAFVAHVWRLVIPVAAVPIPARQSTPTEVSVPDSPAELP
jgi:hypothetical protein